MKTFLNNLLTVCATVAFLALGSCSSSSSDDSDSVFDTPSFSSEQGIEWSYEAGVVESKSAIKFKIPEQGEVANIKFVTTANNAGDFYVDGAKETTWTYSGTTLKLAKSVAVFQNVSSVNAMISDSKLVVKFKFNDTTDWVYTFVKK